MPSQQDLALGRCARFQQVDTNQGKALPLEAETEVCGRIASKRLK